ncbi:MAG TPA: VWA domain-containing protein, partial [Thermoanaerobaculia bacterium]|nr:VWA domain-containing protein [Thermoanaerobaculia bacterium]
MNRKTLAVLLTLLFAVTNIVADSTTPPPASPQPTTATKKASVPDQGVRKLTRRERKDRISKLGEKYQQFLEDVDPLMQPTELDTFLILETDAQRDIYIEQFWRRRDIAQGTTNRAFRDQYYDRLETAKEKFKYVSSDRSRIYLIYGEPMEMLHEECDRLLQPLEIWKYGYIQGRGSNVRFLFYLPRRGGDWKLWIPVGDNNHDLAELISQNAAGAAMSDQAAVNEVFLESDCPTCRGFISKIQRQCRNGDEILRAIFQQQQNRTDLLTVFEPPKINEEDVGKILRSVVLVNPDAPKLTAEFSVRFPAKQGVRTDAEMTVFVPRSELTLKEVGGVSSYSVDLTGEIMREGKLYENYRYRFDYPGDIQDEKIPIIVDRFLRPGQYLSRLKVTDVHSGAEAVIENELKVPEIFDTPEQRAMKDAANATVAGIKDDIDAGGTRLRIVPLPDELLSGIQKIETLAVGEDIRGVEFWLDGKKVAIKRQPPYILDLDFGNVPMVHKIRVVAIDEKGEPLAGDDIVVNTGNDPFRVRIVSPRIGNVKGPTRVEMSVRVPEGKEIGNVQLFLNERRMATLYDPPFVQSIVVPETESVGYLRAVATLKEDSTPPVEDVVMINSPAYMETVDVHLIELPTTVLVKGKPLLNLEQDSFKVLDEGKPVKISKFEYVKNLPLSIGMAVDTSGSMMPRMNETQKAAAQFFKNVMKQGDKAFVVGFDTTPQMVQKWSPRIADVNASLARLRAEEYTALYDAVVFSLYNFLGVKGQRALIVLSDGKDTASKFSFDQTLEYARRAAVPIYVIGIAIRATEVDVKYKMGRLANETGGNTYYIERAEDLGRIYTDIQNELRSQYVLGFYPPEGVKSGSKWREVSVQVTEGKAKTIRGYYP